MSASAIRSNPGTCSSHASAQDLPQRFAAFVADARALLTVELPAALIGDTNYDPARAFVTAVAVLCLEELRSARPDPRRRELIEMALRAADLMCELRRQDFGRRTCALAGVDEALKRLRRARTPDELVASLAVQAVEVCGFSRAMLSRVFGTTWMPWLAHFAHRPVTESDREWMATAELPLNTMPLETEVLLESRAAFVSEARDNPRASQAFVFATGTRSYAVAPIVLGDHVIGLLHADHYPSTLPVDEVDREILEKLADGFGRIYERSVLLERLQRARDHVRATFTDVEAMIDNLVHRDIELVRSPRDPFAADPAIGRELAGAASAIDELLTAREREVMALIVTGQTNSAIAARLVISEGTVKSHVKQILRKVGAINRAEVIGRYFGNVSPN